MNLNALWSIGFFGVLTIACAAPAAQPSGGGSGVGVGGWNPGCPKGGGTPGSPKNGGAPENPFGDGMTPTEYWAVLFPSLLSVTALFGSTVATPKRVPPPVVTWNGTLKLAEAPGARLGTGQSTLPRKEL